MENTKSILIIVLMLILGMRPTMGQTPASSTEAMVIRAGAGAGMDYSATLDFNDERKQLLMAGQNYNTNYGIYVSVKTGPSTLGDTYRTFEQMDFEIVNYKPTYLIGIDSVIIRGAADKGEVAFTIFTRALSAQRSARLTKKELNGIQFENGAYLQAERILNPMFPQRKANGKPKLDERKKYYLRAG